MNKKLVTLYRPIGQKEFELIEASGFQKFPPALTGNLYFIP